MALEITTNYSSVHGLDINLDNAYVKIVQVQSRKDYAQATVNYYQDKGAETADRPPFRTDHLGFVPSVAEGADNIIKQAYDHIKTLDDFTGANDV
jgi:hypothetical protein